MNRSRRGFTLIELLIVVAIMAIIAAVAVPSIMSASDSGKTHAIKTEVDNCYQKLIEAVQFADLDGDVKKTTVIGKLNQTYPGTQYINKIDVSVDASKVYTIRITDVDAEVHSYVKPNMGWVSTEINATTPLSVTITMGADGFWS